MEETFAASDEQRKAVTSRSRREQDKFKTFPGWTKLNTDRASKGNPAPAGAARLVRDALHRLIMGSEAGVGCCNVLKDESWVGKIGLEMAWKMGVRWLLLVFDYQVAQLFLSKNHEEAGCYSMGQRQTTMLHLRI